MSLPHRPVAGWVVQYAFLWRHEHEQRRGPAKDRPALIVASRDLGGRIFTVVCAITTLPPVSADERDASIEIDEASKARLGLRDTRQWVRLDQVNTFVWAGYDLRHIHGRVPPTCVYGSVTPSLFEAIRLQLLTRQRAGAVVFIDRDD